MDGPQSRSSRLQKISPRSPDLRTVCLVDTGLAVRTDNVSVVVVKQELRQNNFITTIIGKETCTFKLANSPSNIIQCHQFHNLRPERTCSRYKKGSTKQNDTNTQQFCGN